MRPVVKQCHASVVVIKTVFVEYRAAVPFERQWMIRASCYQYLRE